MKRTFFLFLMLIMVYTSVISQELPVDKSSEKWEISLQDALLIAMKNNFDIKISRVDFKFSEVNLFGAKGIYDPLLTLKKDYSRSDSQDYYSWDTPTTISISQLLPWGQTISFDWYNNRERIINKYSPSFPIYSSTSYTLSTSIPLLRYSGYTNTNKIIYKAKIDRETADYTFRKNIRDSLLEVENAYWNLVYAREQYKVTLKSLEVARQFQKETQKRILAGTLAPIEQITADAQVAQREAELISAENLIINSEDILKLLLGIKNDSSEWNKSIITLDLPNVEVRNYDEETIIKESLEEREEIIEIKKELEKNRIDTIAAKTNLLPSLTLDGSFMEWVNTNSNYYKMGLYLSFPIGNRSLKMQYQSFKLTENRTEIALEKTKQTIVSEVRNALRNLLNNEKKILAMEANLKLQEEKLDAEKKKFDNGLSTAFNVLSYQNDVLSAESALLKAKIDYQEAVATLEKAIGRYLKFRKIEIEGAKNE